MNRIDRYTQVTETATTVGANWSNRDTAQFHYFNPNGLAARKRELDRAISDAVADRRASSGALIAYGSFNDGAMVALYEFIADKNDSTRDLQTILADLRDAIRAAEQLINNNEAVA
jgi:hypothetical protein